MLEGRNEIGICRSHADWAYRDKCKIHLQRMNTRFLLIGVEFVWQTRRTSTKKKLEGNVTNLEAGTGDSPNDEVVMVHQRKPRVRDEVAYLETKGAVTDEHGAMTEQAYQQGNPKELCSAGVNWN